MSYSTAEGKTFLKKGFVRGAEIYGRLTASLSEEQTVRADLWKQGSQCEIFYMLDHIPAFVCSISEGELEAPTNLVTSEVTHYSFRATWTAPGSPVDKYRVTYMVAAGGPEQEVR